MRRVAASIAVGMALMTASCGRRIATPPKTPLPLDEAAQLVESVREQTESVKRYQSIVRLRGKGAEGRFRATLVVAFEKPDRLHVELLAGPFESSQWTAVAKEGEITVVFPSRREWVRESHVAAAVDTLLGVELEVEDVQALLSGTGLRRSLLQASHAEREGPLSRVALLEGELTLQASQVLEAKTPKYRIRYPSRWKSEGRAVPDRIEIWTKELEASLLVEDADVNVAIDASVFEPVIPEGSRQVELSRVGDESVSRKKP